MNQRGLHNLYIQADNESFRGGNSVFTRTMPHGNDLGDYGYTRQQNRPQNNMSLLKVQISNDTNGDADMLPRLTRTIGTPFSNYSSVDDGTRSCSSVVNSFHGRNRGRHSVVKALNPKLQNAIKALQERAYPYVSQTMNSNVTFIKAHFTGMLLSERFSTYV